MLVSVVLANGQNKHFLRNFILLLVYCNQDVNLKPHFIAPNLTSWNQKPLLFVIYHCIVYHQNPAYLWLGACWGSHPTKTHTVQKTRLEMPSRSKLVSIKGTMCSKLCQSQKPTHYSNETLGLMSERKY